MKTGYYRYKISDLTVGVHYYTWYINGNFGGTSKVIIRPKCTDFKYLKYIDTNGFYRFFTFNNRWLQKDNPTQIGSTNNLITSLKDSLSSVNNVGYKNERVLSLTAQLVTEEELNCLVDIYTSPRVYLNVGPGKEDWVLVTLSGDGIGKRRLNAFGKVSVDIILPETYQITSF